jgi:aminoglycoside phosphotransferase (APT) family kinase protein
LRWLAAFHARFLGSAPEGLWKVGTYWQLGTRPEEHRAMRHQALRSAAARIDAALNAARFKTFVHGDAKLENVCFARAGDEVALVDFQYVGGGVGVKDVAYFLSSCLLPRECAAAVPGYVDDYFRELRDAVWANGGGADVAELEREWRALFPLAWVDFYRFLLGWAPGQYDRDPYSEQLTSEVLASLKSA